MDFKAISKYYLYPWCGFALLFLVLTFIGDSVNSLQEDLIFGQILAIVIAFFIGSILLYFDRVWGPKQRRKLYSSSPFLELQKIGFKKVDNKFIGLYNDYQVTAYYHWFGVAGKPGIIVSALFNPKLGDTFFPHSKIESLNKVYSNKNINWTVNCLFKEWAFNFKAPKFDELESFMSIAIDTLKKENFEPITEVELDNMTEEYESYVKHSKSR